MQTVLTPGAKYSYSYPDQYIHIFNVNRGINLLLVDKKTVSWYTVHSIIRLN